MVVTLIGSFLGSDSQAVATEQIVNTTIELVVTADRASIAQFATMALSQYLQCVAAIHLGWLLCGVP